MNKTARWTLALGYVGFIYSALGVIRIFTNFLRNLGVLNLAVVSGYILVFGICLLLMVRSRTSDWWRYVLLIFALSSYYFLSEALKSPEEKVHFFEYGLVGILFLGALECHFGKKWISYLGAFILGSLAGWLDEIIQKFVPGRYYDVKDILINIESVVLGLLVLATYPRRTSFTPKP